MSLGSNSAGKATGSAGPPPTVRERRRLAEWVADQVNEAPEVPALTGVSVEGTRADEALLTTGPALAEHLLDADSDPSRQGSTSGASGARGRGSSAALAARVVWICGAALWAYVLLGQLVIEADFPEALALLLVLLAYVGAWLRAASGATGPWWSWAPGVLALVLFTLELTLASSWLGTNRASEARAVGLGLMLLGIAQFYCGRLLAGPPKLDLHRAQLVALWIGWVLIWGSTLVVMVSFVD